MWYGWVSTVRPTQKVCLCISDIKLTKFLNVRMKLFSEFIVVLLIGKHLLGGQYLSKSVAMIYVFSKLLTNIILLHLFLNYMDCRNELLLNNAVLGNLASDIIILWLLKLDKQMVALHL